jgi:RNA polymerase sigma-70 factor, ECF subfamily
MKTRLVARNSVRFRGSLTWDRPESPVGCVVILPTEVNFPAARRVSPMEQDDQALVTRAKAGDSGAFRSLVVRYQRKVYAVALGIVRDPDLAWDVAQEAFVRVHQHLADFKGESAFSTWVFRIATHLAIDSVRRERTRAKDDLEDADEAALAEGGEGILATGLGTNPQESALRRELMDKIGEALDRLPEKHRTILVLREVEGLSYEALAERLGINKGTVMSRLFHARRKMQALLRRYAGLEAGGDAEVEP